MSYLDLPTDEQDENVCLRWKAYLTGHNKKLHPNMNINHAGLLRIYIAGLPGGEFAHSIFTIFDMIGFYAAYIPHLQCYVSFCRSP